MGFDQIRISSSGLMAAQKAMEVTSNNVANASNRSYTRQRVEIGTLPSVDSSGGAHVLAVTRMRDVFADYTYRNQAGTAGAQQARADALSRAETAIGPIDAGLVAQYGEFYDHWNTLSISPSDLAAREAVLSSARQISGEYRRVDADLTQQVTDAAAFAEHGLEEANALLQEIATLNGVIAQARLGGADSSDLMDSRDAAADQLSGLTGATIRTSMDGRIEVKIGAATVVTGEYATTLSLAGDGSAGNPLRALLASGSDAGMTGGRIGGMLTAANTDIPALRVRLDAAANALRSQVDAQHQAGFGLDGSTGMSLFSGTSAATLGVNASVTAEKVAASAVNPAGGLGDGGNAMLVAAQRQDVSPSSAMARLRTYVVSVGSDVAGARRSAELAQTALDGIADARQEQIGVNVDEELVELIRYQRAFQASARAVAAADEVLDTLINRMLR